MKQKIIAVVLLLIVISFVSVNTIIIDKHIDEIIKEVNGIETDSKSAIDMSREIFDKFKRMETFIGLTVNHDDITNIEDCFVEMVGYLSIGDDDEAEVVKNRLTNSLEHLRRLSTFTFDAII